ATYIQDLLPRREIRSTSQLLRRGPAARVDDALAERRKERIWIKLRDFFAAERLRNNNRRDHQKLALLSDHTSKSAILGGVVNSAFLPSRSASDTPRAREQRVQT